MSVEVEDDGLDDVVQDVLQKAEQGGVISPQALNAQDHQGNTALHRSLLQGLQSEGTTPSNLIEAGAQLDLKNTAGQTPATLIVQLPQNQFQPLYIVMSQDQQSQVKTAAQAQNKRVIHGEDHLYVCNQGEDATNGRKTGEQLQNTEVQCTRVKLLQLTQHDWYLITTYGLSSGSPLLLAKLSEESLVPPAERKFTVKLFDAKRRRDLYIGMSSCLTWAKVINLPGSNEVICYSIPPMCPDPEVPRMGTIHSYWCQTSLIDVLEDKRQALFTGEMTCKSLDPPLQFQICDRNNLTFLNLSSGLPGLSKRYAIKVPQDVNTALKNGEFGICNLRTIDISNIHTRQSVNPGHFQNLIDFISTTFTVQDLYERPRSIMAPDLRVIEPNI